MFFSLLVRHYFVLAIVRRSFTPFTSCLPHSGTVPACCRPLIESWLRAASTLLRPQEDRVRYEDLHDGLWHGGVQIHSLGSKSGTACVLRS